MEDTEKMMEQKEQHFTCPHCGQDISALLDFSIRTQSYVEDCQVCCHPIQISYSIEDGKLDTFNADRAN